MHILISSYESEILSNEIVQADKYFSDSQTVEQASLEIFGGKFQEVEREDPVIKTSIRGVAMLVFKDHKTELQRNLILCCL